MLGPGAAYNKHRRRALHKLRGGSEPRELRGDETLEFGLLKLEDAYPYAIFAMESPDPGRRRSKNHPAPPHARHTKTRTPNEGSTPRHAAVCSAMVSGIL